MEMNRVHSKWVDVTLVASAGRVGSGGESWLMLALSTQQAFGVTPPGSTRPALTSE